MGTSRVSGRGSSPLEYDDVLFREEALALTDVGVVTILRSLVISEFLYVR
jgi:hypothetical protein